MMPLDRCEILELPKVADPRGNLTFIEQNRHVPFPIRRVYYLYDVPPGAERGGHAHKNLQQVFIAVAGSLGITLDDGTHKGRFRLERPDQALYACPMMWRELDSFAPGSVCLVLASEVYDEADYFRDYEVFLAAVRKGDTGRA